MLSISEEMRRGKYSFALPQRLDEGKVLRPKTGN
jgi:hypothetical protein